MSRHTDSFQFNLEHRQGLLRFSSYDLHCLQILQGNSNAILQLQESCLYWCFLRSENKTKILENRRENMKINHHILFVHYFRNQASLEFRRG